MALTFIGPRDPVTGEPQSYIVGVPARDLSDEDLTALKATQEELVASGLYERPGGKPAKTPPADAPPADPAGGSD